jgi:hypothetical protein
MDTNSHELTLMRGVFVVPLIRVIRAHPRLKNESKRRGFGLSICSTLLLTWLFIQSKLSMPASLVNSRPFVSIRRLLFGFRILCLAFLTLSLPLFSHAQSSSDPLMQLMLAQPRIEMEAPITPVVSFDPPIVRPGEQTTYRVTFNTLETAIDWPDKIPTPKELTARPGAHGQILSLSGPTLVPKTTFNYRVRCVETGQHAIPEFVVKVNGKSVTVPSAQFQVATDMPQGSTPAQDLLLDVPTNSLFVGQTVHARVLLPGSAGGVVQSLGQVQINGQGFIVDQTSAHARIEALPVGPDRRPVNTFVYELMLTLIGTGKLEMSAQGFAVGNRIIGGVVVPSPGAAPQYTLVDSDPITLEVRPLPKGSEPPGFTGAVGTYSADPAELSTNVIRVGEPVKLKVKVHGDANVARLVPPSPPRVQDWQIFPATPDNTPPQIIRAQGAVTFTYTLIPLRQQIRVTPALPFCSFDPDRGVYQNLTINSVPVTVLPGAAPADLQALIQAEAADKAPEEEPVLSGLSARPGFAGGLAPTQQRAWFPLLHLLPAGALLALWFWDRRRRFLEEHPEIVMRRRARRALKRERRALERAASARDSVRFATAAVNAMKVAVAPHYPAEPRALVGADVLTILPETERSGRSGQTVRKLFSRDDELCFAGKPVDTAELLQLQPEIEGVLDHLEARLCN